MTWVWLGCDLGALGCDLGAVPCDLGFGCGLQGGGGVTPFMRCQAMLRRSMLHFWGGVIVMIPQVRHVQEDPGRCSARTYCYPAARPGEHDGAMPRARHSLSKRIDSTVTGQQW